MGEINDFQMETDLKEHMDIGIIPDLSDKEIPLWGLKDKYLIKKAKKALETSTYNKDFEKLARSIVRHYKEEWNLTEKQRNVLYGLLN